MFSDDVENNVLYQFLFFLQQTDNYGTILYLNILNHLIKILPLGLIPRKQITNWGKS